MNALSQQWLAWAVDASWQLALLVCIVAAVSGLARTASARLRHALWLLVLLKVFLPPWLWTPVSVGPWALAPLIRSAEPQWANVQASAFQAPTLPTWLMLGWMAGFAGFWAVVAWRYARLVAVTRAAEEVDEGPARVELERIAMDLGVERVPELLTTSTLASPFLFGVLRPRIVLPRKMLDELSDVDLRAVLTHELAHWKRRDTWIGWLQLAAQSLFWFHPFLWWANRQLRHERECACDETVLQIGQLTPQHYGEAIVRFLTASRGRALAAGSLVGVFERGAKLPERLEHIMSYESKPREFGWLSCLLLAAFAIFFLPMSPGGAPEAVLQAQAPAGPTIPKIVTSTPKLGATAVDPSLKEISVTFDRDMDTGGMSWTGGGPTFPKIPDGDKARWSADGKTCTLPVSLEPDHDYRLGLNSPSHINFQSEWGVPLAPVVYQFRTGARE
jgi:beta-lactamase regulating signal transducer with metallopeptidase domain